MSRKPVSPALAGPTEAQPAEVTELPTWKRSLQWRQNRSTGERELAPSLTNALLVLRHDRAFAGCWALDSCSSRVMLRCDLPVVVGLDPPRAPQPIPIQDAHVTYVVAAMSALCGLAPTFETAARAIEAAAAQAPYDALVAHLDALAWDGVPRLDDWLSRYLGADPTVYASAVGRWWLVSAMARAYAPGCQADHMLVLEGAQAIGKSTAAAILGGAWSLRRLPSLRDYDRAAHALAGRWIVEVGELEAFRGAAGSAIKEFLSLSIDHYRPPYGRYVVERPRRCVYLGTTNETRYLVDATGARRFWPVTARQLDRAALAAERDALLAEARDAWRAGAAWFPGEGDQAALLSDPQEGRYTTDAIEPVVSEWLAGDGPRPGPARDGITIGDILEGALGLDRGRWDRDIQQRAGAVMRRLGWEVRRERERGLRVRRYWRPAP